MEKATDEVKAPEVKRKRPNVLSRLFLCWVCPVLFSGNKRDVVEDDLVPPPGTEFNSDTLGDKFERYWLEELERASKKNRKPYLYKALWRAFWVSYLPGAVYIIGINIPRTLQPLLFTRLLMYWSSESVMSRMEAGYYVMGIMGFMFMNLMCNHHNSVFVGRFGMKVRVACCSVMYRKLLRMSQGSLQEVAAGKLVNLMSNDVGRFDSSFLFVHYLWFIPIQAAVILYLMYDIAEWAPMVGLGATMVLILPLQATLTKLTAVVRRETAVRTDKRIKLMSEIINGIQVIKMYAWEIPFQKVVKAAREYEMQSLRKGVFIQGTFGGFMLFTERTSMFLTILTMILSGTMATATTVYPMQQFFSVLQTNIALILPIAIAHFTEMLVSLERIQEFLMMEEREDLSKMPQLGDGSNNVTFKTKDIKHTYPTDIVPYRYSKTGEDSVLPTELKSGPRKSLSGSVAVEMQGVSASWTKTQEKAQMTLKNISLRFRTGKLCAIIGPVGAGKSSLLQVLLKELPISGGDVNIHGRVSYACQESWLFPATVRENIIFGFPYDSKKYRRVCEACCLLPDFKQFPYGDLSLVSDRGVSLSGGQRARINLARAVYRDADIYILDDPLSAVDANVGRQLFEGCINGYLRDRTRILVTHQVHFLKAADYIVILNEGSVENVGTYDELSASGTEFSRLLSNAEETADDNGVIKRPSLNRGVSGVSVKSEENSAIQKEQMQAVEERATGNLKWSVVTDYLKSVNSWSIVIFTAFAMLFSQATATFTDYWISFWTNQVDGYIESLPEGEEPDTSIYAQTGSLLTVQFIYIHAALILTLIVMSFVRLSGFTVMSMRASKNIHDLMFKNLIQAVMRFFDTNPSGRVLNRFSKDMGGMDELLPRATLQAVQMYLLMSSVLVLNAIALPWTLVPTAALLVAFMVYLRWYLTSAQAIKRLEGTTKSPVFSMLISTISGMSTIRSTGSHHRLIKAFDTFQDLHSSAFHTYMGGNAAFAFYLDLLCLFYLASLMALFLLVDFGGGIAVGNVGLAITQSMGLTMLLQASARFTADFLGQMTAVERVLEYTELPKEKNIMQGSKKPPQNWPSQGNVKFSNVVMSYSAEDPPVLKHVNFDVNSGWKVGVVGRTGAGKSSLIAALFQLTDIEGSVKIDGIDTHGIAKQELRSKISIIPQEPVLFSATVRYNLDPFDTYSDEDIWRALEQVELKDAIPALDFKVSEGGSNFSVGQRQLMCLARAVLRSNKILIMDEATANVDPQTDALIQKTIRREFASCTVLTIAHRLITIMDSDRVLVMDKGEVAEFDHPYLLLQKQNSHLSLMVKETGDSMTRTLCEMAKKKYMADKENEPQTG